MKVVIAPDSFKDALRAGDAADRIAQGVVSVLPEAVVDSCPVADGGEGFIEAIAQSHANAHVRSSKTVDPLGRPVEASWALIDGRGDEPMSAVIELASASGLELLEQAERNPQHTSTFGTGVQIDAAIQAGAKRIVIGIGGSATNDGGCGLAQALGMCFKDDGGQVITEPICGIDLQRIAILDRDALDARLNSCSIQIACDVDNPLTGTNGAAHVYGPQKGATPKQVEQLDAGLGHMASLWREQLGVDVEHLPGAGAAGGVGGGLVAMLGAELVPGAELVLDTIGFDERIKDADLVITGEGRLDSQSLSGKAAMTVAKRCQGAGVPCYALVGSVGEGPQLALHHGLTGYRVIGQGLSAEQSIRRTGELLVAAAVKLIEEQLQS